MSVTYTTCKKCGEIHYDGMGGFEVCNDCGIAICSEHIPVMTDDLKKEIKRVFAKDLKHYYKNNFELMLEEGEYNLTVLNCPYCQKDKKDCKVIISNHLEKDFIILDKNGKYVIFKED